MPPAAVDPALVEAKKTLAKTCDALTSRSTFFPIFDESKGSVDYARWRRDLFTFVSSSGADFTAALEFAGPITPTVRYDGINLVNSDTIGGVVTYTMPQMRQLALLTVVRNTLSPTGESVKLIRDCRHAGGTIVDGGGAIFFSACVLLLVPTSASSSSTFSFSASSLPNNLFRIIMTVDFVMSTPDKSPQISNQIPCCHGYFSTIFLEPGQR